MDKFEFKGSTKDEAIENGLKELGLTINDVQVEVKHYGGLLSKATVILTPIAKEEIKEETKTEESAVSERTYERQPKVQYEPLTEDELQIKYEKAVSFFSGLLAKMEVDCDMEAVIENGEINISIQGPDAPSLIGHRGEIIDALQHFTHQVVNENEKRFARIHVDSHDYRVRRKESLRILAEKNARRAAKSGRPIELEPMNPSDRRIIHSTLQDDKFVTTESKGEGRERRVVIVPSRRPRNDRQDRPDRPERRDRPERTYESKPQMFEDSGEITYGSSSFSKAGPSKTRSFGNKKKKF